jgi:peptidoglycan/xylan/chitin deacetylase (PgdA/CDA1 family)
MVSVSTLRAHLKMIVLSAALLVLLAPLLVAFVALEDGSTNSNGASIAWREAEPTVSPTAVADAPAADAAVPPAGGQGGTSQLPAVRLSLDDQLRLKPNELGYIPILMYHGFTKDPAKRDNWTVTYDEFRGDLTWLWEHNFYIVSIDNMLHNEISAPPGKHPVVLTFDDASSGQFRLLKDAKGSYTPDPNTAVGVMEKFFADHPDFGRGSFFALLPYNCFHHDGEQTTCEERLTWLADHGYEIGNHTYEHQELDNVSDEELMRQVALTVDFINERVTGAANQSRVLVLPYGSWPQDWQVAMLQDGFVYGGQTYNVSAIVTVVGGVSPSPSSSDWSRWNIHRFNADRETWGLWQERIEQGDVTLFTSDGNPATVTIPDPIPADLADAYDPEWASAYDMEVIRYELPGDADTAVKGRTGWRRTEAVA